VQKTEKRALKKLANNKQFIALLRDSIVRQQQQGNQTHAYTISWSQV
jgi:hypothetical protein